MRDITETRLIREMHDLRNPLEPKTHRWFGVIFVLSLLLPYTFQLGSVILMSHRFVLLIFVCLFGFFLVVRDRFFSFVLPDWLFLFSTFWASVSLFVNHSGSTAIEPAGIHFLETFGAYLVARVSVRSVPDFIFLVKLLSFVTLFLVPLSALESISRSPVLLDIFPGSDITPVFADIRFGLRRAQAVFAHPILYGVFVSTLFGFFFFSLKRKWYRLLSLFLVMSGTFFSLSSGAFFSLIVQLIITFYNFVMRTVRYRWKLFSLGVIFCYLAIDLLSNRTPFHVIATYATFSVESAYNRILIWQWGTLNVAQNPFFGLGLNDWVRAPWMVPSVDNFWLLLTMRYGLPYILFLVAGLATILWRVSRATLLENDLRLARASYLVSVAGIILAGGTVHFWHTSMAFVMFIFGSGVWIFTCQFYRTSNVAEDAGEKEFARSSYTRQKTKQERRLV